MPDKLLFKTVLLIVFSLGLMFFVMMKPPLDPDMGWHLRNGQYLWENSFHFPAADIYSYSMSDFPLIMHEWLTDAAMYLLWRFFGLIGMVIAFGMITVAAFVVVARAFRAPLEYQLMAATLGIIASVPVLGTRPQMVTLLFLAILIYLIFRFKEKQQKKSIWLVPLLFFFWANLHGGFALGLFVLGLYFIFETIKFLLFKFNPGIFHWLAGQTISFGGLKKLAMVGLIASLATLVNPYTYRLYQEIIRTLTDAYAKAHIMEWMPLSLHNPGSYRFILYLVLLLILSLFAWRKLDISYVGIVIIFGYLAFSSWRNLPLFMIMTMPFWVSIAQQLTGRILPRAVFHYFFLFLLMGATVIVAVQQLRHVLLIDNSVVKLAQAGNYPYQAVDWLREHPQAGHMFNEYNWGGFLIWQWPSQPVFIDGRMAHWNHQGKHILVDHDTVNLAQAGWPEVLTKYDIKWCFLYKNSVIGLILKSHGWHEVYSDQIAEIIVK